MSTKAERQANVEALTAAIKAAPTIYVTDFSGLNVLKMTDLRRQLRQAGAKYVVVKNTLALRALSAIDVASLNTEFKGPVGLVLAGDDPLPAAKVIGDFAKAHEKPSVKAGLVDGKAVVPAYVKRLGEIPPRDVLLGQFAGAMNSVLSNFVLTLEAFRDQKAGPSEPAPEAADAATESSTPAPEAADAAPESSAS
jgi:large subunit ribosomal protein L10